MSNPMMSSMSKDSCRPVASQVTTMVSASTPYSDSTEGYTVGSVYSRDRWSLRSV